MGLVAQEEVFAALNRSQAVALAEGGAITRDFAAQPEPSLTDTILAAFKTYNNVGSFLAYTDRPAPPPAAPGYNPYTQDDLTGYEDDLDSFLDSTSPERTAQIKATIDSERENRRILSRSGASGMVASIAAGILDPITWIPVGGAAAKVGQGIRILRAGPILTGAAALAAAGAVGETLSEVGLHATQETRTVEESAVNVAGAAILSGILGGAIGAVSEAQRALVSRAVEREIKEGTILEIASRKLPENWQTLPNAEALFQQAVRESAPEMSDVFYPNAVVKAIIDPLMSISPAGRGALSVSRTMRETVENLVDTPFLRRRNVEGLSQGPSVETLALLWKTVNFGSAVRAGRGNFKEFRRAGGNATLREFNEAVGVAMHNADTARTGNALLDDWASRTAKEYRKHVYDPVLRDMLETGLLSKSDLDLNGDASYLHTVFDIPAVRNDPDGFVQDIARGFEAEHGLIREDAVLRANGVLDKISTHERGKLQITTVREAGALKNRTLGLPRSYFQRWLVNDIEAVTRRYLNLTTGELELARRFKPPKSVRLSALEGEVLRLHKALDTDGPIRIYDLADEANLRAASLRTERITEDAESAVRIDGLLKERDVLAEQIDSAGLPDRASIEAKIAANREALEAEIKASAEVDQAYRDRLSVLRKSSKELLAEEDLKDVIRSIEDEMAEIRRAEARQGVNLTLQQRAIREEYGRQGMLAANPAARRKLTERMESDTRDLLAMRDRIIGTYGIPQDVRYLPFRISQALKRINYIRFGGGFLLSQFSDLAGGVFVNSTKPVARSFGFLAKGAEAFIASLDAVSGGLLALELTGAAKRSTYLADVADDIQPGSRFERGLMVGQDIAGKGYVTDYWNGWGKAITGLQVQDRILRDVLQWADGKLGQKQIQNLTLGGIGESMARRIAEQARHFDTVSGYGGKLFLSRTHLWTDQSLARAFQGSVLQDVNRAFIRPGAGDLPLFMSQPFLSLIGQFKSFSLAATQRYLVSGLQRADAAVLMGALSSLALGVMSYGLHQVASGKPISDDPTVLVTEALDRSGMLGELMDINNMVERSFGFGLNTALGVTGATRYEARSPKDALLGATAGLIDDAWGAYRGARDYIDDNPATRLSQGEINSARRLLPAQNLFYLRRLFDRAAAAAGESLGAIDPGRFRRKVRSRELIEIGDQP